MQQQIDQMGIVDRIKSPTPGFFKKLQVIGLVLVTISGSVLAAPIAMPAIVAQVAGYLAVAGTVATAVSQVAVNSPAPDNPETEE